MMMLIKTTAAWLGIAGGLIAAPALATPGSGFTPTTISNGHYDELNVKAEKRDGWDVHLKTKSETDVAVDRLVVAANGQSGWHSHPAPIFVTVLSGEIIWYNGDHPTCTASVYKAGDAFIEDANRIHLVQNATSSTAEFIATRIAPTGVPVRIDEAKPAECPTF